MALGMQVFGRQVRSPRRPVPVETREALDYDTPPVSGLRVTWMGHACVLIEIDGLRVLTDPVWSERVSPSSLAGPKRFFQPPIALAELPAIDAVVISHDHYDHLDMATARALGARSTLFLVPLGVGAHLEKWGIRVSQIRELDWCEQVLLDGVRFTAAPARHFSGRGMTNRDSTLWSSWVIGGPRHSVFFCGDSGFFGGLRDIGGKHGPFDVTLISTGAYSPAWAVDSHDAGGSRPGPHRCARAASPADPLGDFQPLVPRLERAGGARVGRGGRARHPAHPAQTGPEVEAIAQAAGTPLTVPRVAELLADPAFRPLADWLRQRQADVTEVQAAVDQALDRARQAALEQQ